MKFSVVFQPTNLFSLKDSNFTNSGAKSLLLPSPYAIKMALFNQIITIEGKDILEQKGSKEFSFVKDAEITYSIMGSFCVNNCFVTIQSFRDGVFRAKPSFREYIYISNNIEIIFDVKNNDAKIFLQKYLHRINYFGKRGCFFQFIAYKEIPSDSNVNVFDVANWSVGLLQQYDDIVEKAEFKHINNYDSASLKRRTKMFLIPLTKINSSKSYTHFRKIN